MSEKKLVKNSAWDISLDEFNDRILKDIYINPKIAEDIRGEIETVNDLLLHSYYKSNFIDEAYTKAIFTLEKILRIRSKELKNGLKKKDSLEVLFNWFFENSYFETTEITELHQLRRIRNKKVHDPKIFKGSLSFLINIYSIFDLMNDVYEDVSLRLERRLCTKSINSELNKLIQKGFILEINERPYLGHFASVLFYNNKMNPKVLHIRIARCILSEVMQMGVDRDNFEIAEFQFINDQFIGKQRNGEPIVIKPLKELKHIEQFEKWKTDYPLWSLELFDSLERGCYQEKLREFHKY